MARNKVNMEVLDDKVRVKNEPICYTQLIPQNKQGNKVKVKEEAIDMSEEVEEFTNKISIAFLNEETNQETSQATTSKSQSNKPKSK